MEIDTLARWLFIPAIILLGLITSYEDRKKNIIRNKWIVLSLIYSFFVNLALLFLSIHNKTEVNYHYFMELTMSLVLCLLFGYLFYNLGIWNAGDAKLLLAFTSLIPLTYIRFGYIEYFSFFVILINTVIPFFIFYTLILLRHFNPKNIKTTIKEKLKISNILTIGIYMFSISWLFELIFQFIKFRTSVILEFYLLFTLILYIEKHIKIKLIWLMLFVSLLRIIFDKEAHLFITYLNLMILVLLYFFIRIIILTYSYLTLIKKIDIGNLKEGMVPAEKIILDKNKLVTEPVIFHNFLANLSKDTKNKKEIIKISPTGLTNEGIEQLKKLKKKHNLDHLNVFQTIPFAPFLFIGVIITLVFEGNVIVSVISLLLS